MSAPHPGHAAMRRLDARRSAEVRAMTDAELVALVESGGDAHELRALTDWRLRDLIDRELGLGRWQVPIDDRPAKGRRRRGR